MRIKVYLVGLLLLFSIRLFGAGWTPTDAGFVLNFEPGDQFLLSVWVDLNGNGKEEAGEEFFVCDYPSYSTTTGRFKYEAKDYMKLRPQDPGATTPSPASIWTIREPISRVVNKVDYSLGGISYTMWGNSGKTLYAAESPTTSSTFKFLGYLTSNANHNDLCDVVMVVPSDNTRTKCMDPNNTLGRAAKPGDKFNSQMGVGFAGMVYREVYLFDIPRSNNPNAYTNASLVTFNTSSSNKGWSAGTIKPGFAAYAFADSKHDKTTRTLFRLYVLNEKEFSSCKSYFFGWNVQDYKKYRQSNTLTDSTTARKIYALDHFECMERVGTTPYYQTKGMKIPAYDSMYYYVGYHNTFLANASLVASSGSPKSFTSAFKHISNLRVRQLKDEPTAYVPERAAYGYFAVDTTSSAENLGVAFEPAGYFFHTNSGRNVEMKQVDDSTWITNEMWYINEEYMDLEGEVLLFTGPTFSEEDPGAKIVGWSYMQAASTIPVSGHPGWTAANQTGWARIHTNRAQRNGGIEFVLARPDRHIHYDYNGFIGTAIPNQYPMADETDVIVQDARLKAGFTFYGWSHYRNGINPSTLEGDTIHPGETYTLSDAGADTLYALGKFNDTYRVAFSFIHPTNNKRYWLTHPNSQAPRFARARTFTDWTDVYQGMSDAENSEPNYVSTYKMIVNPLCELCESGEVVLDPQHETVHGVVDSLTFYEYWSPSSDEYIGLYYATDPNTVLANNTWAGAFKSSEGWPAFNRTAVDSTKLSSEHYFTGMKTGAYTVNDRPRLDYVKYNEAANQFDGEADASKATFFQITGIAVADAHYVILPDTTDATTPWRSEIVFDYHQDTKQFEQVWSKLIGKQLMACLRVGPDTVYFHPNRNKTFTSANELRLSNDYRLTHAFEYIHDTRPTAALNQGDSVLMEETENAFCCNLYSGTNSPMDVRDGSGYIDIIDTLRVWLRPSGTSKIKDYYGRWKDDEVDGVLPNGYRYRDILIKTKTYHYGDNAPVLEIVPDHDTYNFSALKSQSQTLNFILRKVTYRPLLDADGNEVSRVVYRIDTIPEVLNLTGASATLNSSEIFSVSTKTATGITLTTKADNATGVKTDTLTVTVSSITVGDDTYTDVTVKVPLNQSSMQGDELVWSVVDESTKKRYFIVAKEDGLILREYSLRGNTLYKLNTTTALIRGAADAANSNTQYITPWTFAAGSRANTLTLQTVYGVNKYFGFDGDDATVHADPTEFTYYLIESYSNANGNYEETVRIKYGAGEKQWLTLDGGKLTLQEDSATASLFYWGYLQHEYHLLNNGAYPSVESLAFGYNNTSSKAVTTAYKAYREYSMLLNNSLTYLCREEQTDSATLVDGTWKTSYAVSLLHDSRFKKSEVVADSAKLTISTNKFTTTITPATASPMGTKVGDEYVDIVDTLQVTLGLQSTPPAYRFRDWEGVSSIGDACLKIPLIRKTYHEAPYDSIYCAMEKEEYNFSFPSTISVGTTDEMEFHFETVRRTGTNVLDVDNNLISSSLSEIDTITELMDLSSTAFAEIRLVDEYGKVPDWCEIKEKGTHTVTIRCKSNGVRAPRLAYLYFAYIVTVDAKYRYVNFKLPVSQASLFQYTNNQTLIHSPGASGDPLSADGRQQVHENKRILYYYNPKPYDESDQSEELPVRERGFYGWWRWYQENEGAEDRDIPDSVWISEPSNVGKYNYPFRIIGDSVFTIVGKDTTERKFETMGRYTVFHYPSKGYNSKVDPPSKSPTVMAPWDKKVVTYVVDIGNYFDNLPLSMKDINQVDTAVLDTMQNIIEPTLSLREIFELHPWTEMADTMEHYKSASNGDKGLGPYALNTEKYMEDHVVMAPIGNRLLLKTEQRYNYQNVSKKGHSESLMGYYMKDDNWATAGWSDERKDTMIWCGGWDADCVWYTYNPKTGMYAKCNHPITVDDDFLNVPAKAGITAGQDADTVYYCLRAQSRKSTHSGIKEDDPEKGIEADPDPAEPEIGDNWFNICRYKVIYHDPRKYGPYQEKGTGKAAKAIITNDEIEQNYEVLERLNFDYIQPGKDYHVYPHPLPWADGSYGYSYPVGPEIPDNRYHNDFAPNFPGPGEYGIINRIPYSNYWHKMEQHGGAENGYMIYCDGMSSSGQVAALTLNTHLCEGQKMYFSAYVGNPSNQVNKSNPNFTFSVQGSKDGVKWTDITSYMTGDIKPSDKWSQIFFPIEHDKAFNHFRVRVYNMASDFDGNDFIIDDMCIFATKPPLIAYQANTKCVEANVNDSIIHVVLRVDYQGFTDLSYNNADVAYTVEQMTINKETKDTVISFVPMVDHYLSEDATHTGRIEDEVKVEPDTIYGTIHMPARDFVPLDDNLIFSNLNDLADRFEESYEAHEEWEKAGSAEPEPTLFRQGYIYENLDGIVRPVLYVVHKAKMTADKKYKVRMSLGYDGLMSSICAMTSDLSVTNRMMLMLNGEEQEDKEVNGMCANTIYDVSLRVRGTLIKDSVAPMPLIGSCTCDWLLYGDTVEASSLARYGYKYRDIEKVIRDVLRYEPGDGESNSNRFARNLGEVNRNVMDHIQQKCTLSTGLNAYEVLADLVNKGFLTLYESNILVSVHKGDSVQYTVFPIVGTGTEDLQKEGMGVCPVPLVIKLKTKTTGSATPLIIGGLHRDSTQANLPITILADADNANKELVIPVDSIRTMVGMHAIDLISTDDPDYREGVHKLSLTPDRLWPRDVDSYYMKGDRIILTPTATNNYAMRPGYSYTFNIEMVSASDDPSDVDGCPIGNIPFIVSVVPDILRWEPADSSNNQWNNPMNWIGVDANNNPIHENARFAPLSTTDIIIPAMTNGMPYPALPDLTAPSTYDSVQQVGFVYNTCDDIRFLPGAAINQQQHLNYDVVVADMTIPYGKWAFRSAPVRGMISGDIFMADADLLGTTKMWSVGSFDADARNYTYGNASYWLSVYSRETIRKGNNDQVADTTRTSSADWSKVTNALSLPLPAGQGWAVYTKTESRDTAFIRLPKSDDRYYYFYKSGGRVDDLYEDNLMALRNRIAGGSGAGELAFSGTSEVYTITNDKDGEGNDVNTTSFVFGNPTMGYIDIWGFIADNCLKEEFDYMNESGAASVYTTVVKETAKASSNTISNPMRFLPPMHAIVVKVKDDVAISEIDLTLYANRIVTDPSKVADEWRACGEGAPASAPRHRDAAMPQEGIMTITAINPVSARCTSRLLLGQGYHNAILAGEDAVLTTINIDNYSNTSYPATPFNIYAQEGGYGLSIDLLDSIVNVPLSFCMSEMPYEPVTYLWFTGVHSIDGPLVLYDALTDTERRIIDGICLDIHTPEASHERRYFIRRPWYMTPQDDQIPTGVDALCGEEEQAVKFILNGQVFIVRKGHIYSMFGQIVR